MKKKIASLLLSLTLCLGLYPAALAAEPEPNFVEVKSSHDYVEVGTQTAVDGKEYPLFIYPAVGDPGLEVQHPGEGSHLL